MSNSSPRNVKPSSPSTPMPSLPPSLAHLSPFSATSRTRLQALYSDIARQRHSSPDAYHANVEWWSRAIESLVESGTQGLSSGKGKEVDNRTRNKLVLGAGRELVEGLRVEGVGKPLGLGAVVVSSTNVLYLKNGSID
jgi:charged multivesicular body protein 7